MNHREMNSKVLSLLLLGCMACQQKVQKNSIFAKKPPQNLAFKKELKYLRDTKKLDLKEKQLIETTLLQAQEKLGVPQALLWCILFQESRFDSFKNALNSFTAKGLGQFTPPALVE